MTVGGSTTNLPIAIGLIAMMYPALAKVRYEELPDAMRDKKALSLAMVMNWIVAPTVMFLLAVGAASIFPDYYEYMVGLIIIGIAPCIAMVIVWNGLAEGDCEFAAGLVAINCVMQILFFGALRVVLRDGPAAALRRAGRGRRRLAQPRSPRRSLIYLGIPFAAGIITRFGLIALKGKVWYDDGVRAAGSARSRSSRCSSRSSSMFSLKGDLIVQIPLDVRARRASDARLLRDHVLRRRSSSPRRIGLRYAKTTTLVVHRRLEQLRARHRRVRRGLRHQQRPGVRGGHRPARRGPGADRAGQRRAGLPRAATSPTSPCRPASSCSRGRRGDRGRRAS